MGKRNSVPVSGHSLALSTANVRGPSMNALWIIPFFRLGGALQSAGAAMNGQLNRSLGNPWLASAVTFALITFFFSGIFLVLPSPLPSAKALSQMPWWAPIGGLVGAVQV